MRVDLLERKVAIGEANPAREMMEEELDRRRGLLAIRTFEIAVLDDRDRRIRWPDGMIG